MHKRQLIGLASIILAVFALSACSKSAPKCSAPETAEQIKKIIKSELRNDGMEADVLNKISINMEAIRTTSSDEKTGRQECACNLILEGNNGAFEIPITYTSELTDNKGEFYTQVFGFNMGNIKKKRTAKSDLSSLVFSGIHSIQTNIGLHYAINGAMPGDNDFQYMTQDADTTYFTPSFSNGKLVAKIKATGTDTMLTQLNGKEITFEPVTGNGKITEWKIGGVIAKELNLN